MNLSPKNEGKKLKGCSDVMAKTIQRRTLHRRAACRRCPDWACNGCCFSEAAAAAAASREEVAADSRWRRTRTGRQRVCGLERSHGRRHLRFPSCSLHDGHQRTENQTFSAVKHRQYISQFCVSVREATAFPLQQPFFFTQNEEQKIRQTAVETRKRSVLLPLYNLQCQYELV